MQNFKPHKKIDDPIRESLQNIHLIIEKINQESKDDMEYQNLIIIIKNKLNLPQNLSEYKNIFQNFEVKNYKQGDIVIFNGVMVIVPKMSRKRIHQGHFGYQRIFNQTTQ